MVTQGDKMEKFEFLIGDWDLDYSFPKSEFSKEAGTGIFAWDNKANIYRYWWFESSGSFSEASCRFIDDDTLFLNWHDGLLIQTFRKDGADRVMLSMEHPDSNGEYQAVLSVRFDRR